MTSCPISFTNTDLNVIIISEKKIRSIKTSTVRKNGVYNMTGLNETSNGIEKLLYAAQIITRISHRCLNVSFG